MARYAIPSDRALGVPVGTVMKMGKALAPNHALAQALWDTGIYEARLMASFVDDPAKVTSVQMDRWCREFDNWAVCDTVCFKLFDRVPHAWSKVEPWSRLRGETSRRAAFVLLACLALHDKEAKDAAFLRTLSLIERGAADERNFVKKAVNWALRAIGGRNAALNAAAIVVARRLAESAEAAPRWVGKDALRGLTSPAMTRRLSGRRGKDGR
jgi:3-methyladenine DNA glycosylase AlkD